MLEPCKKLESAISVINQVMNYSQAKYWLSFGALYGLIRNNGVIPDSDLDICVNYGTDHNKIVKAFSGSPGRYNCTKVLLSDTDRTHALYAAFSSAAGYPHICLSFWYEHDGIAYYCHDQKKEVEGEGVPAAGYFFKGVPVECIQEFKMVEWPGIPQMTKIRVPRFPGRMLDNMYPDWAYRIQKYNVENYRVNEEKLDSYHKAGATSPYEIHVTSMAQFKDSRYIKDQLSKSRLRWDAKLKSM